MNLTTVKAKECPTCKKSFGPCPSKRKQQWDEQKYCSQVCSAKARAMKSDEWRAKATKECPVCNQVFRPSPGMKRGMWLGKTICDRFCESATRHGRKVIVADPLDQATPQRRLKWLRLSASKCGKKVPWSLEVMAQGCAVSEFSIWKIECGGGVTGNWMKAAAERLGVDFRLFTVPVERFAKIVNDAGLSAKISVPAERRAA